MYIISINFVIVIIIIIIIIVIIIIVMIIMSVMFLKSGTYAMKIITRRWRSR